MKICGAVSSFFFFFLRFRGHTVPTYTFQNDNQLETYTCPTIISRWRKKKGREDTYNLNPVPDDCM
jgi:hypothetical protein